MLPVHVLEEINRRIFQADSGLGTQFLGGADCLAGRPLDGRLGGLCDARASCHWSHRLLGQHRIKLQIKPALAERIGGCKPQVKGLHEAQQVAKGRALVILQLGEDLLDLGAVKHLGQTGHGLDRVACRDIVRAGWRNELLELEPESIDGRLDGLHRRGFEIALLVLFQGDLNCLAQHLRVRA